MTAENPPPLLAVGRLARAHGIRGRVLVAPFNEESIGLERVTALWLARPASSGAKGTLAQPKRYAVAFAERVNLGYIFQLRGIDDCNASEALRGLEVSVARSELPDLDEGELFTADLIGLSVADKNSSEPRAVLGKVISLEAAGPNELLVVELNAGEQVLVPLAFLHRVDEEKGQLLLEIPQGLFESQLKPAAVSAPDDADGSDAAGDESHAGSDS